MTAMFITTELTENTEKSFNPGEGCGFYNSDQGVSRRGAEFTEEGLILGGRSVSMYLGIEVSK